jgi:lipoyl synthase
MAAIARRIPRWIKATIPSGAHYRRVKTAVRSCRLHTVCLEARCPNIGECFAGGTVTFLLLGTVCTRRCRYCAVAGGAPEPPDAQEPERVARAAAMLDLSYVVVTSVTRDDLPDGGAEVFAATVRALKAVRGCRVELLVPDFYPAPERAIELLAAAGPDVVNHNIEVVRPLFRELRPQGDYDRSLRLLERIAGAGLTPKSGLMVGLGESPGDIRSTLQDLYAAGCRMLTIGQYLQAHRDNVPVAQFYTPGEFAEMRTMALDVGFDRVQAGPLVRSSYHAAAMVPQHASERQ